MTPALFKRYPDARALAKATSEKLEPQIHSTGFFRAKSKALIGMAQALKANHNGEVPADMEALSGDLVSGDAIQVSFDELGPNQQKFVEWMMARVEEVASGE